nr:reverse transcriptase domain, reverse transcriptase zinc-binding domain protein [Tanacetum cinerariifolium]
QNAFINGRFILDGVLIANETMEFSKKKKEKSLIFKGDFEKACGLKVNYNKGKIYGIGFNKGEMVNMARWMGFGIGEFSFTYLGLTIGENMRRVDRWVDNRRLCDRFHRLYHLDRRKESSVMDRDRGLMTFGVGNGIGWTLEEKGEFMVKELARLVEEKILHTVVDEPIWNNLVPKK